ncbi:MAG TPA: hypothetical protein VEJ63_05185 [Planctomycetota bacterium]|nr:hypothetical protein [Planctomycetota bacterium]
MKTMSAAYPHIVCVLALAVVLPGCGSSDKAPAAAAPASSSPQDPATVTRQLSATELKETEAFAQQIEKSINSNDPTVFQKALSLPTLGERTCAGLGLSSSDKKSLIKGMSAGTSNFGNIICQAVQKNGSYALLRMRVIDDKPHALFRMLSDGAVNYHELRLNKTAQGAYEIEDAYVYMAGEWLSETMRRMLLPMVAHQNRGVLEKLRGTESAYVKNIERIGQINNLVQQGKGAEALRVYASLPAELHPDRTIQLVHVAAAQQAGEEPYAKALEEFQKFFPDAAWADLILIDAYFLTKQYAKGQNAISRLDRSLGGDPYLNVLRGSLYNLSGEPEKAKAAAQAAIQSKLGMPEPYLLLVELATKEKAFAEAVVWFAKLRSDIKDKTYELEGVEGFEELVESPEYKKYISAAAEEK